jgi:hypothetical protein
VPELYVKRRVTLQRNDKSFVSNTSELRLTAAPVLQRLQLPVLLPELLPEDGTICKACVFRYVMSCAYMRETTGDICYCRAGYAEKAKHARVILTSCKSDIRSIKIGHKPRNPLLASPSQLLATSDDDVICKVNSVSARHTRSMTRGLLQLKIRKEAGN